MSTGTDPTANRSRARSRQQGGFSMAEALLSLSISALVAAGIGSMLVSSIRSQANAETYSRLQASWYLAANLLETEASIAERLLPSTTASTGCANLPAASVQLVMVGPANAWQTYYGVRPLKTAESSQWHGPNVLVRCGRPLGANATTGVPEVNISGAVSEGVITDGLPSTSSFSLQLPNASVATGVIARTASVTLSVEAIGGGAAYTNDFALRLPYNPIYGYNNDIINGLTSCSSPCKSAEITLPSGKKLVQYRPTGTTTITGDAAKEDVVYINANSSAVSLSSGCSSSSCVITNGFAVITTTNVNTIVFNDGAVGL